MTQSRLQTPFRLSEDGGNPLYRGGTSLEGQECLTEFYEVSGGIQGPGNWLPELISRNHGFFRAFCYGAK